MTTQEIELVYFRGCPNADVARANVRAALEALGRATPVTEWDQLADGAPERIKGYGSPTVLVNGRDITGVGAAAGATCRAEGAPSVAQISAALASRA
ncbi:MAG: hypothetical protein WD934_04645 [Gemmatimonadales bacterium]